MMKNLMQVLPIIKKIEICNGPNVLYNGQWVKITLALHIQFEIPPICKANNKQHTYFVFDLLSLSFR